MPREIVTLSVGQAGNQISWRFWDLIAREHASLARPSGDASGRLEYDEGMSTFFRNTPGSGVGESVGGSASVSRFGSRTASSLEAHSLSSASSMTAPCVGSLKARALLIDTEEGVVSQLLRSPLGGLFDRSQLITDVSGAGNNWAHGYAVYGPSYREVLREGIRASLETCDSPQSFFMLHSTGGGTGSGLGSSLFELLADDHPSIYRFSVPVFPSAVDDVVTSPYNFALTMASLVEHADAMMPLENQALSDIVGECEEGFKKAMKGLGTGRGGGVGGMATLESLKRFLRSSLIHVPPPMEDATRLIVSTAAGRAARGGERGRGERNNTALSSKSGTDPSALLPSSFFDDVYEVSDSDEDDDGDRTGEEVACFEKQREERTRDEGRDGGRSETALRSGWGEAPKNMSGNFKEKVLLVSSAASFPSSSSSSASSSAALAGPMQQHPSVATSAIEDAVNEALAQALSIAAEEENLFAAGALKSTISSGGGQKGSGTATTAHPRKATGSAAPTTKVVAVRGGGGSIVYKTIPIKGGTGPSSTTTFAGRPGTASSSSSSSTTAAGISAAATAVLSSPGKLPSRGGGSGPGLIGGGGGGEKLKPGIRAGGPPSLPTGGAAGSEKGAGGSNSSSSSSSSSSRYGSSNAPFASSGNSSGYQSPLKQQVERSSASTAQGVGQHPKQFGLGGLSASTHATVMGREGFPEKRTLVFNSSSNSSSNTYTEPHMASSSSSTHSHSPKEFSKQRGGIGGGGISTGRRGTSASANYSARRRNGDDEKEEEEEEEDEASKSHPPAAPPKKRLGSSFDAMNNLAAHMLANLTASMRFEGSLNIDLNEVATTLVPFPKLNILQGSVSPLFSSGDLSTSSSSRLIDGMFGDAFQRGRQLLRGNPRTCVHLACGLLTRGDVSLSDVNRNVERLKRELTMAHWNQDGFKVGLCAAKPTGRPRSLLVLSNNSSIVGTLSAAYDRFMHLYRVRAHLHHYTEYIDASVVADALTSLVDIISRYNEVDAELDE